MLGPTIIAHGTEEQKQRYLAPMLHGDEVWCQLFSEPAAGSDLAGSPDARATRRTTALDASGQKVWTTNAQFAAYGLLLARTNPDVPKHKGLTMFIVPMDAEGVTVRALRQISGEAEFNEVFFDDVQLEPTPWSARVDGGWGVALTTLMFERLTIGARLRGHRLPRRPLRERDRRATRPPRRTPRCGRASASSATELLALRFTGYRLLTAIPRADPRPGGRHRQVTAVNGAITAGDLIADVLGPEALDPEASGRT